VPGEQKTWLYSVRQAGLDKRERERVKKKENRRETATSGAFEGGKAQVRVVRVQPWVVTRPEGVL